MGAGLGGGALTGNPGTAGSSLTLSGNLTVSGTANFPGNIVSTGGASWSGVPSGGNGTLSSGVTAAIGSYGSGLAGIWFTTLPTSTNFALIGAAGSATYLNGSVLNWWILGAAAGGVSALGGVRTGAATIPDATGTPGNVTQNSPRGRAAIANLATSITVTNSECTINAVVVVTFEADPLQRHWVVPGAGSFVLNITAAAAGNLNFRYVVFQ